jgi:hypothetical protein
MITSSANNNLKAAMKKSPPVGSAHERTVTIAAVERTKEIFYLQSKGFIGGVPLNTETAAVKPRVGIER